MIPITSSETLGKVLRMYRKQQNLTQTEVGRKFNMTQKTVSLIEAGKRGGKPCIRGMRITVYDVLDYLASGMNYQEILADFPYLTQEDILACLKYAAERERYTVAVPA